MPCKILYLLGLYLSPSGATKGLLLYHLSSNRAVPVRIPKKQRKLQLVWTDATLTSAVHSRGSRNKDDVMSAKVFLTPLSATASHYIRKDFLVLHVRVIPACF